MSDFYRQLFRAMREQGKTAQQFSARWSEMIKRQRQYRKDAA